MDKCLYKRYLDILHEELLPAMGCTEPISVAYAAALARDTLGAIPESVHISVSGNILKNVKSVVVPNTGGLKGVTSAAAAGIVGGTAEKKLEVISSVTPSDKGRISEYLKNTEFSVEQSRSGCIFDITVKVYSGTQSASVRIAGHHTNVVHIDKNGEDILDVKVNNEETDCCADRNILTIDGIIGFADSVKTEDVKEIIERLGV